MPAPAIKAIIFSVSLVTALGIAIYENPEVQRWLQEQRDRLLELLRSIGAELDPQTRREAEAFAFEGRSPINDEGLRREAEASREAAALATGRSVGSGSVRRIPVKGPETEEQAEERRRLGREYLAKRNQTMFEMRERRKQEGDEGPTTPTFDAMVDTEGELRPSEKELPDVPLAPLTIPTRQMGGQPITEGSGMSGWQMGARLADPFSDEFEMERSSTPKPPVPPKIEIQREPHPLAAFQSDTHNPAHLISDSQSQTFFADLEPAEECGELSYEEQLAIALSLSEADSQGPSATVRQVAALTSSDADLRAAIEASLRDMDHQQAAHAVANDASLTPRMQPLVDLTPDPPTSIPQDQARRMTWEELFKQPDWKDHPANVARRPVDEEDDLYSITPQLTRARLADLNASHAGSNSTTSPATLEPATVQDPPEQLIDASFYSAHSRSTTPLPPAINSAAPSQTSTLGFETESASERFASLPTTRTQSIAASEASLVQAPSEASEIEVLEVEEDSDDGVLSSGVLTPDSWSEVEGSEGGESEEGERETNVV
ncbi:hypothetical protein B0A48_16220 [Cryoendolithus antarcticus]|uniref:Uncharacterized protein n=1 Tax=Cryoendolithus antarcticus TaxID=1507870 RepID=A0A1V8SFQ4_9PEZI|nr:hypothetical protein B0A48_16220 [Cryoendolithus antarcticus]